MKGTPDAGRFSAVIVITGPGRSGTSFIAHVYKQLGFDPGGDWQAEVNAGLEALEVVRLNLAIAGDLGLPMERALPRYPRLQRVPVLRRLPMPWSGPRMVDWEEVDAVVERHGASMVETARDLAVVKDPKFLWTLPFWLRAGAEIDHVLIAVRSLDDAIGSRFDMGREIGFDRSQLRNSMTYGLGLLTAALHDHRVPYGVVRFPDFVDDPSLLYNAASFPREVSEVEFMDAADAVRRPDLVHRR